MSEVSLAFLPSIWVMLMLIWIRMDNIHDTLKKAAKK